MSLTIDVSGKVWNKQAWLFSFGAHGDHRVIVWADSLEDALEEAAGNLPRGYFVPDDYLQELQQEAAEEGDLDSWDDDLTYTESGYIAACEWFVREITKLGIIEAVRDYKARGYEPDFV